MSRIPRVLAEGRGRDVALVTLFGIGQAIALGLVALATRNAFATLHEHQVPAFATLAMLCGGGCAVAGFEVLSRIRAEALGQGYAKSLRLVLYRHIAGMSASDLARHRLGGLSLRFVGDLAAARGWVGLGLTRVLSTTVVLPGAAIALYLLSPDLALAGTLPVVLAIGLALGFAIGLRGFHAALRSRRARIAVSMMERIALGPALDSAGRTGKELAQLKRDSETLRREAMTRIGRLSLLRALPQAGAALGGAAILWTAGASAVPAAETAGALAALSILVLPLRGLADVWDRFCAWRIARSKCEVLLRRPSAPRSVARVGAPVPVHFDNVIFQGLRIDGGIPAGATAFVNGGGGSGKSSLLSLAAAQDRAERGTITYGSPGGPLPRIAYITDRSPILHGSLRRSLTLGVTPRPDGKTLRQAARAFGLRPLLSRLGGEKGRVHEGGRTLASGEVLRVALVRAALSQPDLIVIDSAQLTTDPKSGRLIRRLSKNTNATVLISGPSDDCNDLSTTIEIMDGEAIFRDHQANVVTIDSAA